METLYNYNSVDHWAKSNKTLVLILRIGGLYFLIGGILYFTPWNKYESTWELVVAICLIAYGALAVFFPRRYFRPRGYGVDFVTIDDRKITWSIGSLIKPKELLFQDIESYKIYVGEVHFKTKQGEIVKLSTYKILDKEKHDAFFVVLKSVVPDLQLSASGDTPVAL